jgi:hypothetical protein
MLKSLNLLILLAPAAVLAQQLMNGGACPPGGGNFCIGILSSDNELMTGPFTNIILRCGPNNTLIAGNCNDNVLLEP